MNSLILMVEKVKLFFLVALLSLGYANAQINSSITDSLFSTSLNENRRIKIVLPSVYSETNKELYGVIYVLDGEWYTELAPNAYNFAKSGGFLPNTIIVLISNVYIDGINQRNRDFEPYVDKNGSKLFLSFLEKELLPYIDKKYPNNGQKNLLGSSLGGLFAVHTFLTNPDLFQAYVACDPNLDWEKESLAKLAETKLPTLETKKTILFIATNDYSFETNGGKTFNTVLQTKAPKSIHWQLKTYQNETHYSVQYKAFYDGLKYIYSGCWPEKFDFAPRGGFIEKGKPIRLFVANKNPSVSYTLDGTDPTEKSPRFAPDQAIIISKPATLNVKTIATRDQYKDSLNAFFYPIDRHKLKSEQIKDTSTVHLSLSSSWDELPSTNVAETVHKSQTNLDSQQANKSTNAVAIIKKTLKVDTDSYYVFVIDAPGGSRLYVGHALLINSTTNLDYRMQSFAVYLKKGSYKVTAQLRQIHNGRQPVMRMFRTTTSNDKWWENEL